MTEKVDNTNFPPIPRRKRPITNLHIQVIFFGGQQLFLRPRGCRSRLRSLEGRGRQGRDGEGRRGEGREGREARGEDGRGGMERRG